MDLLALQQLVVKGESETLEFKRTTAQLTEGCRTVCGMLNGLGGFVLIGVANDGRILGQDISQRTLEEIANELRKLEPPAFPETETITLDSGRAVIAIRVSGGSGSPYSFDGRPYQRYGPTTVQMQQGQYERRLLERMHATARWENRPATSVTVAHLDQPEIVRTVEEAIRRGRLEDPGTRDPVELLTGLGVMRDGELLNAAVVLFGTAKKMLPNYPQCLLRMARFRGVNKGEFIDNRQEVGHIFDLLERAQRFLRDHLPVAGRIQPNLFERIDDPLYPPAALREALANAFAHRDYGISGGAVDLAIYDDRLEIISTGLLPFGLTPADLMRPHQSRPWNPLIAQVLHRRGIIESWGRGTLKMAELNRQAGLSPPQFESEAGVVLVRFLPTGYVPPSRIGHDLSPLQQRLLEVLAITGSASLSTIKTHLDPPVPERTVQENLQLLRRLELVDSSGKGRGARWLLNTTT